MENSIQKAIQLKMRGLLLFPVMHRFNPSDPKLFPVYDLAQKNKLIILVHFGLLQVKLRDLLGLPRPFDLSFGNPLSLQIAANRYRELIFVIPHFGCGFFRETLMLGSQCENVYVDTSSSNNWRKTQTGDLPLAKVFQRTRDVFGSQRILFGTDSSTFPRGWRQDILHEQLEAMEQGGLSQLERDRILGQNIREILGL